MEKLMTQLKVRKILLFDMIVKTKCKNFLVYVSVYHLIIYYLVYKEIYLIIYLN